MIHPNSMTANSSLLRNKTVAVLGFNARPIACSAKRAGARVIVSDYWGDEDLEACSSKWRSILTPRPGERQRVSLEEPVHVSLVKNLLDASVREEVDHIFVGSGFDDNTQSLKELEEKTSITGNSTSQMQRARNRSAVCRMAEDLGLRVPTSMIVRSLDDAYAKCDEMGYPCLIRPTISGGGSGISFVKERSQVEAASWRFKTKFGKPEAIVQQYKPGLDGSACVLSTGEKATVLSVQGQLIGMPSAGRNCDFVYSGNYLPMRLSRNIRRKVIDASNQMIAELELQGTNGIDFIIDKDEQVWFLEINPRFQGSLEMLEHAGSISLTEMHTAACDGILPSKSTEFSPSMKLVVFSRKLGSVPNLADFENTSDRTPEGVRVKRGDPLCTVIATSSTLKGCYERVLFTSDAIQRAII